MAISATLKIANQSFDVLQCKYGFHRKIDSKGYPKGGFTGGYILISLESTSDTLLLEKILTEEPLSVPGSLEFWDEKEQTRIRTLEWSVAYIYSVGEYMQSDSSLPMTMTLKITPLRLDINRDIRIDRRFPQTYAFWWEEYKEEEQAVFAEEGDSSFTIVDAYWKDENGKEIRDLSIGTPVTLYVVLGEFTAGSTISFTFEDEGEDGIKQTADCSGTVSSDGIVIIEDFKIEPIKEEGAENGNT